jgi:hypothetical protein
MLHTYEVILFTCCLCVYGSRSLVEYSTRVSYLKSILVSLCSF